MMLSLALAAAASAAPATSSPARGSVDYNVRCMVAGDQAAGRVSGATKTQLGMVLMFYFGRVDSTLSGNSLKQHLGDAVKGLEGRQLGPVLQDCAQFMNARGKAMEGVRRSLAGPARGGSSK